MNAAVRCLSPRVPCSRFRPHAQPRQLPSPPTWRYAECSDAPSLPPRDMPAHQWGLLLNGNGRRTQQVEALACRLEQDEDPEPKGQQAAEGEGGTVFDVLPTRATSLSRPHLPGRKRSTSAKHIDPVWECVMVLGRRSRFDCD